MATLDYRQFFLSHTQYIRFIATKIALGMIKLNAFVIYSIFGELIMRKQFSTLRTFFGAFIAITFALMFGRMLRLTDNFQIFNAVIQFVPVFMMDDFLRKRQQFPPKMIFHNYAMFGDLFPIYSDFLIPIGDRSNWALPTQGVAIFFEKIMMLLAVVPTVSKLSATRYYTIVSHIHSISQNRAFAR